MPYIIFFRTDPVAPVMRGHGLDSVGKTQSESRRLLGSAEIARLLQTIELRLYLRVCSRGFEKSVFGNGSRTGILEGRSYDPREALRAIQGTRLLVSAPFLLQVIHFDCFVYLRRSVEICAVIRPQNT